MDITKDLAEHLGLALAVAGSTFVAVRLWAVAHFDTTTALAILAEQGTSTVVGGTLIYLLSYVPFVIAVFLAGALGVSPKKKRVYLQLSVAGAILGSFFIPWPIAVVFFFCWAILIWTGLTSSRDMQAPEGDVDEEKSKSKPEKKSVPRSHLRGAVIFGLGLWLLIDATLWLPPENVEIRGVEQPLTAYVLNDDPAVLVKLQWERAARNCWTSL